MSCENCPVKCGMQCVAEKFNAKNLCEKVNPDAPDYNPAYGKIIADKSCGTQEYKNTSMDAVPSPSTLPPRMPSLWQQVKNLTGTMVEHVKDGLKNVSKEEYEERLSICQSCDYLDKNSQRCTQCGCAMKLKSWLRTATCPENKWPAVGIKKENEEGNTHADNPEN